jgi:hypothetical protein
MRKTPEERDAATLAKTMILYCLRNTHLETLHSGKFPVSKIGDYSDVKVIDGEGTEIPWRKVARFDNDEMKKLMKEFVNRAYTFLSDMGNEKFEQDLDFWKRYIVKWDEPEKDGFIARAISEVQVKS